MGFILNMQIRNQTQFNNKPLYTPNFKGNWRTVKDELGKVCYRNNTEFFRIDLNWNKFTDMLIDRYRNADRVHVYNYACSEGAEPFSLAMLLIKKVGDQNARKFFPIIASDVDETILVNPKQGKLKLSLGDIYLMRKVLGNDYLKFVSHEKDFRYSSKFRHILCNAEIKPILKGAVEFHQANILDEIGNIEKDNSLVMCRNFWPYLSKENRQRLTQTLSERLGSNSMCVIGSYDRHWCRMKHMFEGQGMTRFAEGPLFYQASTSATENECLNNPNFWMNTYINRSSFFSL